MNKFIKGLHHVTAITTDAQKNIDFYAGILGLRLVKKTVNFDAPDVYHLYFGNESGDPGTILTFFPFPGFYRGKKGIGQVTATSFSVPVNSLDYWMKRLSGFEVDFDSPRERFNERYLYFEDFDGLGLELVEVNNELRKPFTYGNIPSEFSIRGFHSVRISVTEPEPTARVLTELMDHTLVDVSNNIYRYSAGEPESGFTDLLLSPGGNHGRGGAGTVHHVAFATPDDTTQAELRKKLFTSGIVAPTPVTDRQYFHSVYFREPGGVLFEAATCDIGFTLDETIDKLGESLKLPPWEEINRKEIEGQLPQVKVRTEKFSDYEHSPDSHRR